LSNLKKIIVSLPETLLQQIDCIMKEEEKNRSELVREALALFLKERKIERIRREMAEGYREMGMLNLNLSEEGIGVHLADLDRYEQDL
jgi:CopG family transcriptional regulator/antitoxin EndoAI